MTRAISARPYVRERLSCGGDALVYRQHPHLVLVGERGGGGGGFRKRRARDEDVVRPVRFRRSVLLGHFQLAHFTVDVSGGGDGGGLVIWTDG